MKGKSLLDLLEKLQIDTSHTSIKRRQPRLLGGEYSMPEILTQNCSFDSKFRLWLLCPMWRSPGFHWGCHKRQHLAGHYSYTDAPLPVSRALGGIFHTLLARCNYWIADVSYSPEEMMPWLISKCPQLEKLYQCDSSSIWQQACQANPPKKVLRMF